MSKNLRKRRASRPAKSIEPSRGSDDYLDKRRLSAALRSQSPAELWACCHLIAEHLARTYRYDQEDLVQAATLKAYVVCQAGKVCANRNPFSYLTTVVMNELNHWVKKEARHAHAPLELDADRI